MMINVNIDIPVHTVSEMNTKQKWKYRAYRLRRHKKISWVCTLMSDKAVRDYATKGTGKGNNDKITLNLIRHGKRKLDQDNLASSFKGVIDGVCGALGVDDGDVDMTFSQTVKNKQYSVTVGLVIEEGD